MCIRDSLHTYHDSWVNFIKHNGIDAICCSASCEKWLKNDSKQCRIEIAGLPQLVDAYEKADRVITFGERQSLDD